MEHGAAESYGKLVKWLASPEVAPSKGEEERHERNTR